MVPPASVRAGTVRAFLDAIVEHEKVVILRGRCYEQESVPYKALDSLVDALGVYLSRLPVLDVEGLMPRDAVALARLFPTLRRVESFTASRRRAAASPDPLELRRRAFEALRELLARIADRHPMVLAIDDLQWGDVDSASLLAALLRPPDAPAILADRRAFAPRVATRTQRSRRSRPTSAPLASMSAISSCRALDVDEARALALVHLGSKPAARAHAARVVDESPGQPVPDRGACSPGSRSGQCG